MIRSLPDGPGDPPATTRSHAVETAASIFVNGITGVFIGMAVLYVAMKLIALATGSRSDESG